MMRLTTRPPSRFSNCFSQQLRIIFKPPNINPLLRIGCKLIQIIPTEQPNRILIHKAPGIRFIIPEEVIMQPRFTVGILVLQAKGLVCAIRYLGFLFQTAPAGIVAEPQQITVLIWHLTWDADLVAVEVVGLLTSFDFFVGTVVYLCQRVVAVGIGVDIGISTVPNESGFLFEAV